MHEAGVQPVLVGLLGGEAGLDLVVFHDPAGGGVDQEHPARLEAALGDHGRRVEVEHARLAGEHDQAAGGAPPAARAQAVAVEDRADDRAVGERDRRRPVPRLHQAGVEPVERPARGVHAGVVLPRLGDHHERGVRQAAAGQVQQFEHLVEGGRVGGARRADGQQPLDVAGDGGAGDERLAGGHPVAVAADGVDLAVVRDVAVRVGQRPARERVGGEPAVHQRDGARHAVVAQFRVEAGELVGGEHPLPGHRPRRQRREVHLDAALAGLAFGLLAHAEGDPVEFDAVHGLAGRAVGVVGQAVRGQEHLRDPGHRRQRAGAEVGRVDGNIAPGEYHRTLDEGVLLDDAHGVGGGVRVGGQEREAGGVRTRGWEVYGGDRAAQRVGYADHDAGPVAGVGLGTARAPVVHAAQGGQPVADHVVRRPAGKVCHERHAARVVLVRGVVQALRLRRRRGHRASCRRRSAAGRRRPR
jgi:hypothetical protein